MSEAATAGGTSPPYMANQIARFFESQGDHATAVAGAAQHIKDFWTPSMRQALIAMVDAGQAPDLSPIARDAILSLR